jgi:hypothetical protein
MTVDPRMRFSYGELVLVCVRDEPDDYGVDDVVLDPADRIAETVGIAVLDGGGGYMAYIEVVRRSRTRTEFALFFPDELTAASVQPRIRELVRRAGLEAPTNFEERDLSRLEDALLGVRHE